MDISTARRRVNELLLQAMERVGVDSWLVLTREYTTDPITRDIGADRITGLGAVFFCLSAGKLHRQAIVVGFNVDPLQVTGIYDKIEPYRGSEFWPKLNKLIGEFNPKNIAINCSGTTGLADGLTSGIHQSLQKHLASEFKDLLLSSEDLIIAFRSQRLSGEVEILREAAVMTEKILRKALSREWITPGKTTEKDLVGTIHDEMKRLGVDHAWDARENPVINTGLLRGHTSPSDRIIEPGHIVKLDYGILFKGMRSDLQRSAYVLKPGEPKPPKEIVRLFDVTRKAIDLAVQAMKPGTKGVDIDKIARDYLMSEGFPSYRHATGHPIGYDVHDLGPYLAPDWPERYGKKIYLPFEVDQVFCVEPAAPFYWPPLGGDIEVGLEDEVVITQGGAEYLCHPQTSLWVIDGQ